MLRSALQHICAPSGVGTQPAIGQRVQRISVPAARRDDDGHEQIAGLGASGRERAERRVVSFDLDQDRAQGDGLVVLLRHLSPLLHMLRTLNLFAELARVNCAPRNLAFLPRRKSQVSSEGML
jgi:hypothetical protein